MCLICVEFQMQRLTLAEARRNLREYREVLDDDHITEVETLLEDSKCWTTENLAELSEEAQD